MPIPVVDDATITILTTQEMNEELQVFDVSGKLVESKLIHLDLGNNSIKIDLTKLTKGIYTLNMKGFNNQYRPIKFVKF